MKLSKQIKERISPASKAPVAHAVGRRKSAVARVWLSRGEGSVVVNGKAVNEYFDTNETKAAAVAPFTKLPALAEQYGVQANVNGGGLCAQADAIKLGIARALVSLHEDTRSLLREHGFLTVDSRLKERKKYGQKAARRKFQFVKR